MERLASPSVTGASDAVRPKRGLAENLLELDAIKATDLTKSPFFDLEGLVRDMDVNIPSFFSSGFDYFLKLGILPIIESHPAAETGAQEQEALVGKVEYYYTLAICETKNGQQRDHQEIWYVHNDLVLPQLRHLAKREIKPANIEYIVLPESEFKELQSFATDAEKRRAYLDKINDDTKAQDTFYAILDYAIRKGATDIHIERNPSRVRYRVDGTLYVHEATLSDKRINSLISHIKSQTKMKLEEKNRPQDGSIVFGKKPANSVDKPKEEDEPTTIYARVPEQYSRFTGYSLRLSTMPTPHGEKLNIRLHNSNRQFDLASLGYRPRVYSQIEEQIMMPHGVFLVTGPTGSGKTTTLYSILQRLNEPKVNIVTIEDPIEIELPGINQSQVNEKKNWTFDKCLRHYLRQDPDIILVGEIRDGETAKVAMEAANTGHFVLSTLHTNDAISSLLRLYELGCDKSDLIASLNAIAAQRLVRILCPDCRVEYDATPDLNALLKYKAFTDPLLAYRPGDESRLCRTCSGAQYKGRTVVSELWVLGDKEKEMIYEGCADPQEYLKVAVANKMKPMMYEGIDRFLKGQTTLTELTEAIPVRDFIKDRERVARYIMDYKTGKNGK